MRILVINDDGITSPGIYALATALEKLGEVMVVSPAYQQTGAGHSMTLGGELKTQKRQVTPTIPGYAVWGTPRDCCSLGVERIYPFPDLIVSGINEGPNLSSNVVCSGTCGGACTALEYGIPSIAVSLDYGNSYDYSYAAEVAYKVAKWWMTQKENKEYILNVNVPNLPAEEIKGIKVCRYGGNYSYRQAFTPRQEGDYIYFDTATSSVNLENMVNDLTGDIYALQQGYVTITPTDVDVTKNEAMAQLQEKLKSFEL